MIQHSHSASIIAAIFHAGQKRKYTGLPYTVHCFGVAKMVAQYLDKRTDADEVIAAAVLHDILEDTPYKPEMLIEEFPIKTAALVLVLTDVGLDEGNRATRKQKNFHRICMAGADAQLIKACDFLDNLPSILAFDRSFAKLFVGEMQQFMDLATLIPPILRAIMENELKQSNKVLGINL